MKNKIDILVYVALGEEFQYIKEEFTVPFKSIESKSRPLTYYIADVPSIDDKGTYSVMLVPAGTMGNTNSGAFVSSLIDEFKPMDVIVLGIAGSLSNDLKPGDVLIPSRVGEYMANSAGIGDEDNEYETSGNYYDCDRRLVNRLQNFSTNHTKPYKAWQKKTENNHREHVNDDLIKVLSEKDIQLNRRAKLFCGEDRSLASGPTVGKGNAFSKWLKTKVDRKFVAMEMESAGVFAAVLSKIKRPRVLAIRGISDFATEKKAILEETAGNSLRTVSMKNATAFLQMMIQEGVFLPEKKSPTSNSNSKTSLLKKVFVLGGETGENPYSEDEKYDLQKSCKTIGAELAKANIELIVCSPFSDSADYYTASGYADEAKGGTIHFHFPANDNVLERKAQLEQHMKRHCKGKCPRIVDWQHPSFSSEAAKKEAWLLCQLQALDQADAVISLGGRSTNSANTLLHLAEIKKLPVVPFTFLGGASKMLFDRINWQALHPKLPVKTLTDITGPKKVISLLRRLLLDEVEKDIRVLSEVTKVFISRAKPDAALAEEVAVKLRQKNLTVLFGDDAINSKKAAIPAIEEYIKLSHLCIVFWSANYALSPWCHDELMFAINRQNSMALNILIFNIDDTPIIPTQARSLNIISATTAPKINEALQELLNLN